MPLHPSEHQLTVEWRDGGGWGLKKRVDSFFLPPLPPVNASRKLSTLEAALTAPAMTHPLHDVWCLKQSAPSNLFFNDSGMKEKGAITCKSATQRRVG